MKSTLIRMAHQFFATLNQTFSAVGGRGELVKVFNAMQERGQKVVVCTSSTIGAAMSTLAGQVLTQ